MAYRGLEVAYSVAEVAQDVCMGWTPESSLCLLEQVTLLLDCLHHDRTKLPTKDKEEGNF